MLFCLFHWNQTTAIHWVLTGYILCLSAFTIPRCCVSRKGIKRWGVSLLVCEILCSAIWQAVFFDGGSYHNYGLQGGLFFLIYPILLVVARVLVTQYPKFKKNNKEHL